MVLVLVLAGCVQALLARAGTDLLLAILRPMVGLDPNANGLFQQPIIRDRMQAFLGEQYEPVMQLLSTADRLQQEGPLFFVISRYTPIPDIAEQAGFVWNAEANQMAVMLVTGGSPTIIAEQVLVKKTGEMASAVVPQWPAELQAVLDADALRKQAADAVRERLQAEAAAQLEAELEAIDLPSPPTDMVSP